MDFLLDNPLATMEGPAFLVLFILFIVLSTVVVAAVRQSSDKTEHLSLPAIPPEPDPYEIAYLRGGANETARAAIFSLAQKGAIEIIADEKRSVLRANSSLAAGNRLTEMENAALAWIGRERMVDEAFKRSGGLADSLDPFLDGFRRNLESRNLIGGSEARKQLKRYARFAAGAIAVIGGYKVAASIAYGQFNIIFTIILTLISVVIVMSVGRLPRVTKLGKKYLERLQLAFDDLKRTSQAAYIRTAEPRVIPAASFAGVDPLLLSVGLFGGTVLVGTVFDDYNTAFQRSMQQASSGSGGCGSGCGSGSSSGGDGGSGCGSGCGGGGCGGGGCGG